MDMSNPAFTAVVFTLGRTSPEALRSQIRETEGEMDRESNPRRHALLQARLDALYGYLGRKVDDA